MNDLNKIKFGSFKVSNNWRTILRHSEFLSAKAIADIACCIVGCDGVAVISGDGSPAATSAVTPGSFDEESDIDEDERSQALKFLLFSLFLIENSDMVAHE